MKLNVKKHIGNVYVLSDIHNDFCGFQKMLYRIRFKKDDTLYILGDVFDKGRENPQPIELYFEILKHENIFVLQGNHDHWLAKNLRDTDGKYKYNYSNSYYLIKERLPEVDRLALAVWIEKLPLQILVEVDSVKYLFGHAQTAKDENLKKTDFFLFGDEFNEYKAYLEEGIPGYVSVIGHTHTDSIRSYMKEQKRVPYEIWTNRKNNVIAIDCANGSRKAGKTGPRLACIRLNDRKCFYV